MYDWWSFSSSYGYWTSSTTGTYEVLYQYVEDLMEEEEPKEKELGFFKE